MSEPKFTPGPWALEFDVPRNLDVVIVPASFSGDFSEIIGFAEGQDHPGDGIPRETQLANAHLIAAAPDLFAALEKIVRKVRQEQREKRALRALAWCMAIWLLLSAGLCWLVFTASGERVIAWLDR